MKRKLIVSVTACCAALLLLGIVFLPGFFGAAHAETVASGTADQRPYDVTVSYVSEHAEGIFNFAKGLFEKLDNLKRPVVLQLQSETPVSSEELSSVDELSSIMEALSSQQSSSQEEVSSQDSSMPQPSSSDQSVPSSQAVSSSKPSSSSAAPPSSTSSAPAEPEESAPVAGEVRAMWISYLEYGSMLKNKSESTFTAIFRNAMQTCKEMGINTVYIQARSYGDAYYPSDLYPWAANASGTFAKSPGFDPFGIMVREAHAQGMSVHAWINPFRGPTDAEMAKMPSSYPMKQWYDDASKKGHYIVKHTDGRWYLNPGVEEARQLVLDGAKELIQKYPLEGLVIDDYFYPTTAASFDAKAFQESGSSDRTAWRKSNCDKLVKGLYDTVKGFKASMLFGVSPDGTINNNYTKHYADVRKWCSNTGYLDYISPQIYFGFQHPVVPYQRVLDEWNAMIKLSNIQLIPSLAAYKVGVSDQYAGTGKNEWIENHDLLSRQLVAARKKSAYGGIAFFRYDFMVGGSDALKKELSTLLPLFK